MSSTELKPLDYELPKSAKLAVGTWISRLQAVAIITVLFAGVQAQLIGNLPGTTGSALERTLAFFAYSGLLLNLGGTLSAVLLLIAITSVPISARHLYVSCSHGYPRKMFELDGRIQDELLGASDGARLHDILLKRDGEAQFLRAFGIARGWDVILRHCIFAFLAGCICTFLQIALTLWVVESTLIAALIMPIVALAVFPPLYVFFCLMNSHACTECAIEKRAMREEAKMRNQRRTDEYA